MRKWPMHAFQRHAETTVGETVENDPSQDERRRSGVYRVAAEGEDQQGREVGQQDGPPPAVPIEGIQAGSNSLLLPGLVHFHDVQARLAQSSWGTRWSRQCQASTPDKVNAKISMANAVLKAFRNIRNSFLSLRVAGFHPARSIALPKAWDDARGGKVDSRVTAEALIVDQLRRHRRTRHDTVDVRLNKAQIQAVHSKDSFRIRHTKGEFVFQKWLLARNRQGLPFIRAQVSATKVSTGCQVAPSCDPRTVTVVGMRRTLSSPLDNSMPCKVRGWFNEATRHCGRLSLTSRNKDGRSGTEGSSAGYHCRLEG